MLSRFTEFFIVLLIVFAGVCGIPMLAIFNHARKHPENREASSKWLDTIQHVFWIGMVLFVLVGACILITATHSWL